MRYLNSNNPVNRAVRYLALLLAGGLLAVGFVGAVSAHEVGEYRGGSGYVRGADYGHERWNRGHNRGHFRSRLARPKEMLRHDYRPHRTTRVVVIHRSFYTPEPVYVERRRVLERRHYVEPGPVHGHRIYQGPSGSSLIGAAIGGLLGSQVGKGDGKLAATAAGAVAGYWVGAQH